MTRELFARATDEPADPSTDDRIIEVALQSLPGVVAASDLARALGWKLERARRALDRRLQPTGARLHRNGWQQYAIRQAATISPISSSRRCIASAHATTASTTSPHDCCSPPPAANSTTTGSRPPQTANAWPCRACSSKAPSSRSPARPRSSPPRNGLQARPYLREQPAPDELRPSGGLLPFAGLRPVERWPEDHPTDADAASATEKLVTPD